jgi:type III secretion protein C
MIFSLVALCYSVRLLGETVEVSHSMSIPFSEAYYYHFSKDQKLSDLIQDFCSMQNISVVISSNITDVVNGRFNKMLPSDFWDYVTRAYGLTWFFDGKILYVYKGSELQTRIYKMDAAGIVILSDMIRYLGFSSSDFSFRSVPEAHILIITAPPKYLETIGELSEKFVTEKISDTTVVKSFPLKYAWAYDMSFTYKDGSLTVPGVATLLQNIVTGQNAATSVSGMSVDFGKGGSQKMQKMQALVMQTKSDSAGKPVDSGSDQNASGEGSISGASTLPGFITCDQRLNSIIIRDRYENMAFYEDIIKQLDVPCEVIKIDVAILDINRNDGLDLGINLIRLEGETKGGNRRILSITPPEFKAKNALNENDNHGSAYTQLRGILKRYDITSYVKALENSGNSQTIAKPSVLTLDNVGAIIEQDSTAHIKVAGDHSEGLYDVTATTKLQVVPHIIPGEVDERGKHKMKMFVNIQDGTLTGMDQEGATPGVDSSSINTQAVLYEGQSLLIGGYFHETHTKARAGIPFIMDIPLIGNIFQHTTNTTSIKERIYLISPSIVDINSDEHEFDKFVNNKPLVGQHLIVPENFIPKPQSRPRKRKIHAPKPKLSKGLKRRWQRKTW